MGTIDILLNWHYLAYTPGVPSRFVLVDGLNDEPKPLKSYVTHSDAGAASEHALANTRLGDPPPDFHFWSPQFLVRGVETFCVEHKFDLILSLGSWCFHYEPAVYLDAVLKLAHRDTVFIADVRSDRFAWEQQLRGSLVEVRALGSATNGKARRVAMRLA